MTMLDVRPATPEEVMESARRMEDLVLWTEVVQAATGIFGPDLHQISVYYDWAGVPESLQGVNALGAIILPDPRAPDIRRLLHEHVESIPKDGRYVSGAAAKRRLDELFVMLENDEDAGDLEQAVNMTPMWLVSKFRRSSKHQGSAVMYSPTQPPTPVGTLELFVQAG